MNFKQTRAELGAIGVTLLGNASNEFCVRLAGSKRGEGYFTNDLADAFATGKAMAKEKAWRVTEAKPNAAILFAPLRVVPVAGAYYEVRTKQDDTPASRNNFCLVSCENENEAQLFAAAPELLAAAENARAMLLRVTQLCEREETFSPGAVRELCRDALAPLCNAIAKAKGGAL